ncbi:MAG: MoaD/ThiS family protein [Desulfosarcinaceae bacterium]
MTTIELRLFANLAPLTPPNAMAYPIDSGISVGELLARVGVDAEEARLIFINGVRADLNSCLYGKERVGVFPPVGGG